VGGARLTIDRLLVANRGEIAVRVLRTAADLGMGTVSVYSDDDADAPQTRLADEARPLGAAGPAAYLDAGRLVAVAAETGCDAVHPGYGFLSEDAGFARRCAEAGLVFVGPRPRTLELFGDKTRARALAESHGVPVLAGTGPVGPAQARAFLAGLEPGAAVMVKAVAGGGGRGTRLVRDPDELDEAYARCASEALAAFGSGEVYLERFLPGARHVEVQILGDGRAVAHLWDRECTLQRRRQKLVEIAPCPSLPGEVRRRLRDAAVRMAAAAGFDNLGTFEFLVDAAGEFAFVEANPRLQVEHTVTEEVTGVDLVAAQLALASGATLAGLGLAEPPEPRGLAVQVRINAETLDGDGTPRPATGTIAVFEPPSGPRIRVDTCGHAGYRAGPRFDSLLAKLVVRGDGLAAVLERAYRALGEFRVEGLATNIGFLQNLLRHPRVRGGDVHTGFVDEHIAELARPGSHPVRHPDGGAGRAGARVDSGDPLAVLTYGQTGQIEQTGSPEPAHVDGLVPVHAPVQGTVISVDVSEGQPVAPGRTLLVLEAMKMEHAVTAATGGTAHSVTVGVGDTIVAGHVLVLLEPDETAAAAAAADEEGDLDAIRPDLDEVLRRHDLTLDASRPDAVGRRRATGQRTARENLEDLCDEGSFVEYGPLAIAAQRRRRPLQDLIERTPADGLVTGVATVNAGLFGPERARCAVMAYDYTVLAGTQGHRNHYKMDRMFELAARRRLPLVLFAEGGGGRPGDTDGGGVAGLDVPAFRLFARLSALVPVVGIVSGRCFAGNASLLGCCDVIIATADATIGMGGPAMIEGGGLGVYRPEEVGPMRVQVPNGVVDVPVADEAEAVTAARRYLAYFQGPVGEWECADQRRLRRLVPENRLRAYDVRRVIDTLADTGTVFELRRGFGAGMITALARVEGRPLGVIANNPAHLGGAIDSDAADKAARFMQLCDAFDLPVLLLCDTPGIMVGPQAETTALVRHANRMFVTGANLGVPFFTIVLRKAYGLGAMAMAGGDFKAPLFAVAWPTGEFGGMGIEGAVKLGYRKELAAIEDPAERREHFERMVEETYQRGKALNVATHFELDDVIDPADSRRWIADALTTAAHRPRDGKRRPNIDAW
jgi:acetyl/propionyl-CoA carboxylase alpha subunit/acetyl-CoA carboxylase carboxyltransferase component